MTTSPPEIRTLFWQEICVKITMKRNYSQAYKDTFNQELVHIIIKAKEPLPITETGFKSIFLPMDHIIDCGSLVQMIQDELDQASQSQEWKAYQTEKRQLTLF